MTNPQLPERPNLDQLKRQAKDLLRLANAGEPRALARFRTLPAYARGWDDDRLRATVALHDAQSVIARELGFRSWNELREHVEQATLDFDAAVREFVEAATEVRPDRAARLLQLYPKIAAASVYTALLLGDDDEVGRRLARDASLATQPGGPRSWPPLLYVCHTAPRLGGAKREEGLVAIGRRLLAAGADPNTRFPWLHHGVQRPALWGAVFVTQSLPLAEALLDAGASASDGVTLPLAAGSGNVDALELLYAHGADVNQPWATDGAATVYAVQSWADRTEGIVWLLEHGADADPVFAPNGETPLHAAARRGWLEVVELLVRRGAEVARRRADGRTPYALAELNGQRAVADWLSQHGGGTPEQLSDIDRFVSACNRGDRASATAMLARQPTLANDLSDDHYTSLYRVAEQGDTSALETMLVCGFDPNRPDDEIGKTALHAAAHGGQPDAVRVLLAHGASVSARDREFHGQPLVWAADGSRTHGNNGRNYDQVAKLLLDAGSPVEWEPGAEPSQEVVDIIAAWRKSER